MVSSQPNDPMAQVQAQLQQLQSKLVTVCTTNVDLANQLNTLQGAGVAAPVAPQAPTFADACNEQPNGTSRLLEQVRWAHLQRGMQETHR